MEDVHTHIYQIKELILMPLASYCNAERLVELDYRKPYAAQSCPEFNQEYADISLRCKQRLLT